MDKTTEGILRRRMHGLYLTRPCENITQLSHELLGMHSWFHRNVAFSALIRGADLVGWQQALTKTWIHHALHGVAFDDLPALLAVNSGPFRWGEPYQAIAEEVLRLMQDGITSRAEMRPLFADQYEPEILEHAFSPWGGVFVELARLGKVAFRSMTSRDFDLIDAEPTETYAEVLPELFNRFLAAYGPATIKDAVWFFGLQVVMPKDRKNALSTLIDLDAYGRFEYGKKTYYYIDEPTDMGDIPEYTLLSGFDPLIAAYMERGAVLPPEYKKAVITRAGICMPSIAINGQVAGLWNIKNDKAEVEFFTEQPKRIKDAVRDWVEMIRWGTAGRI